MKTHSHKNVMPMPRIAKRICLWDTVGSIDQAHFENHMSWLSDIIIKEHTYFLIASADS